MSNSSWAPSDESSSDLWLERSNFSGNFLGGVALGVHAVVYFSAAYFSIHGSEKRPWGLIAFITALFALGTINAACNQKFSEMAWIDDRNIPGGPDAWVEEEYSIFVNVLGNAAYITSNFLADAMIIYRMWVIWGRNYYVIILPVLTFMASTALSILTLYQTAQPGASLWSSITISFAVPYWSLSIALNILVTLCIVYRLITLTSKIRTALSASYTRAYTSISAMLVESAALYSVTGMIFIICYARSSNVQNLVLPVLGQVMCIAPELIVLRVALGRAWTSRTADVLMSSTNTAPRTAFTDSSGRPSMTFAKRKSGLTSHVRAQQSEGTTVVEGKNSTSVLPMYEMGRVSMQDDFSSAKDSVKAGGGGGGAGATALRFFDNPEDGRRSRSSYDGGSPRLESV